MSLVSPHISKFDQNGPISIFAAIENLLFKIAGGELYHLLRVLVVLVCNHGGEFVQMNLFTFNTFGSKCIAHATANEDFPIIGMVGNRALVPAWMPVLRVVLQ